MPHTLLLCLILAACAALASQHDNAAEAHHPDQFQTCYAHGQVDQDCDGFTLEQESLTGTNGGVKCSATGAPNDSGVNREIDAWPPDANNNQVVSLGDIGVVVAHWGNGNGGPNSPTYSRGDINGDGLTDIVDLGTIAVHWAQNCNTGRGPSTHTSAYVLIKICDEYICSWVQFQGKADSTSNSGWNGWYYFIDQQLEQLYGWGIGSTGAYYNWDISVDANGYYQGPSLIPFQDTYPQSFTTGLDPCWGVSAPTTDKVACRSQNVRDFFYNPLSNLFATGAVNTDNPYVDIRTCWFFRFDWTASTVNTECWLT